MDIARSFGASTSVEQVFRTQVIRNSQCADFPGCMDPETGHHSNEIHVEMGLCESQVVQSYWHRNPLKRAYFNITGKVWGS